MLTIKVQENNADNSSHQNALITNAHIHRDLFPKLMKEVSDIYIIMDYLLRNITVRAKRCTLEFYFSDIQNLVFHILYRILFPSLRLREFLLLNQSYSNFQGFFFLLLNFAPLALFAFRGLDVFNLHFQLYYYQACVFLGEFFSQKSLFSGYQLNVKKQKENRRMVIDTATL